jgi:hypothetical protein
MRPRKIIPAIVFFIAVILPLTGCDPVVDGGGTGNVSGGGGGSFDLTCDPNGFGPLSGCDNSGKTNGGNTPSSFHHNQDITDDDIAATAEHESMHVAVAHEYGWRVVSSVIFPDGSGKTNTMIPGDASPLMRITLYIAPIVRDNTAPGMGIGGDDPDSDYGVITSIVNTLPFNQRGLIKEKAEDEARRIVAKRSNEIDQNAHVLEKSGTL